MKLDRTTPVTATNDTGSSFGILGMSRQSSASVASHLEDEHDEKWTWSNVLRVTGLVVLLLLALWVFMIGLVLMADAFKALGGCEAGNLFDFIENPIAGLMIGVLATVLVQSSSTTTSIVVSLVAADGISVRDAIPIIMGANIGTTVTSTLVACGQIRDKAQFELAFTAATVHDMFNILAVVTLLPLEVITHVLFHLTDAMVDHGTAKEGNSWESPIIKIVKPISKEFIEINKTIIKNVAKGKISCDKVDTIIKGGMFYYRKVSDGVAGTICLIISLILVIVSLIAIVKVLNAMLLHTAEKNIKRALNWNGYLMMLFGAGITFIVQSSSITTSILVPLVGLGILNVEKMFPMVLGANIGTTGTALFAAFVSGKDTAVQIALCHLFFNVFGILIWYPSHFMRKIPIKLAKLMGWTAARIVWFPIAYIVTFFCIVPALLLGISYGFEGNVVAVAFASVAVVIIAIVFALLFLWCWNYNGRAKTVSWIENYSPHKELSEEDTSMEEGTSPGEVVLTPGSGAYVGMKT